jgi:S-adenosyl-L-methionine hydrolase (adenosine-forming)
MQLITLTSDLGLRDNYVALVKASILKEIPQSSVIDISHDIEKFNIMQAAYIFGNAYAHFPEHTIHLIGIKSHTEAKRLLYIEIHKQKIICPDNGFFTLLSDIFDAKVYSLREKDFPLGLFFLKDSMVKAAAHLMKEKTLATACEDYLQLMSFQPTATSDSIVGRCLHIDSFGNVVTNITQHFFDLVRKGRKFTIHLPGSQINKIVSDYGDVPETNALALFNSFGYLEIAINRAKASQLLFPKNTQANVDFNITVQFTE